MCCISCLQLVGCVWLPHLLFLLHGQIGLEAGWFASLWLWLLVQCSGHLTEPLQIPRPRWHPKCGIHPMCRNTHTTLRTNLPSHLQHWHLPLTMEGVNYSSNKKSQQARLHETRCIPTHSLDQLYHQNTVGMHIQRPNWHLPANHFGCRLGRTTSDSLHYVSKFTKDTWRKGEVVSALFLNIRSAFPSVILKRLIHDMRSQGIPTHYTDWIHQKVSIRRTYITFNGHVSEPRTLSRDLDQGCPLSGITFYIYNADLIDIPN